MLSRSYRLKILVRKLNLFKSLAWTSASFNVRISYNPIHKGRVGHGAFFLLCSPNDNPMEMWYSTSYMTNLSMANFSKTCRAFFTLYIQMKVPRGEAYQYAMSINSSIDTCNMQGRSCSKIIMYTKVTKWCNSCMITPWKFHLEKNLQ